VTFPVLDLFAGVGGFHAALTAMGGEVVQAAEIDDAASAVYERTWGLRPDRDVVDLASDPATKVKPHSLLAGGFPCQPFSKSGRQLGISEERGRLFDHVVKILQVHTPPVVALENVRNIAGPRQRHVWRHVVDSLRSVGYATPDEPTVFSPHLLPPWLGGGPQARDRVHILGTYVGRAQAARLRPEPVVRRRPVDGWDPRKWDITELLEPDHTIDGVQRLRLTTDEQQWVDVWNDLLDRLGDVELPGFPLWSTYWHDGAVVDSTAPGWKQAFEAKNIAFYNDNRRAVRAWLHRQETRLRGFPASRQKLEWQAQDSPRDLRACLLQFRPSGIRAKKPTYAPALVAMNQTPVIGPRGRRLSPVEAARLQGFDDNLAFDGQADTQAYKQLGNAVHVGTMFYVVREHVLRDAAHIAAQPGGSLLVESVRAAPQAHVPSWWQRATIQRAG
jgi:DNA (cytosine-5)-methyltransferase 1